MVTTTDTSQCALRDADIPTPLQLLETAGTAECCQCSEKDVKYRCPRCERLTCSLSCCVGHKTQVQAASDKRLSTSDYRLLCV